MGSAASLHSGTRTLKYHLQLFKKTQKKQRQSSSVRPSAGCVVTPVCPATSQLFMCIIKGRTVICDLALGRQASSHLPHSYYVSALVEGVISSDAPVSTGCLCRSLSCIRAAGAVKAGIWQRLKAAYLMTGAPVQIRRQLK